MIKARYFLYRTLRFIMIPFVWVHIAFHDQRIVTFVRLKKEVKTLDLTNF